MPLDLPIECVPGKDCWIVNYVDAAPDKGASDYNCGGLTYDGHRGVDFAIRDLSVMNRGVAVLAATPGTVVGVRDGMRDIDVNKLGGVRALKGKDCGNGVLTKHDNGWTVQYCHMRKGSVVVKKGDTVKVGQRLGLVGYSGNTMFPHLHFHVKKGKKVIDPFVGLTPAGKCGLGKAPLWKPGVLKLLQYRRSKLYNVGFTNVRPKATAVREGRHQETVLSQPVPLLILWVDIFGVSSGDVLTFSVFGPDNRKIIHHNVDFPKKQARVFRSATLKRQKGSWPSGKYRGVLQLVHQGSNGPEEFLATREVTIR